MQFNSIRLSVIVFVTFYSTQIVFGQEEITYAQKVATMTTLVYTYTKMVTYQGTGFFYADSSHSYVVSNRHVFFPNESLPDSIVFHLKTDDDKKIKPVIWYPVRADKEYLGKNLKLHKNSKIDVAAIIVDSLFIDVLEKIEAMGVHINISNKSAPTSGGYYGLATLNTDGYPPINIEINISSRSEANIQGEVDGITNNFVPTYTLYHLPQEILVNEKIFGALMERKKPRDFYDLYFMMRKGMLSADQKKRLSGTAQEIIAHSRQIDFQGELGTFLPANQQDIIRNFPQTLERELRNQLSFNL